MIGISTYPTYQVFLALVLAAAVTMIILPGFIKLLQVRHVGQQIRLGEIEADQLPVKTGPEAAPAGEQIHSLQQIGFSLRVGSGNYVGPRAEAHSFPLIIAKAVQCNLINSHTVRRP